MRARSRPSLDACVWTMSQFLAKVEAIRKALGLRPAEELPAPLAISEAMVLMGIKANETWALPERVEALVEALDLPGFGKSPAATQAAAPAPPAPPAPKPAATMPVPASAPSAKAEDHSRYGSRSIVDRTVLGLPLIVLIQVLESGRIGPSLIDTAFQTA